MTPSVLPINLTFLILFSQLPNFLFSRSVSDKTCLLLNKTEWFIVLCSGFLGQFGIRAVVFCLWTVVRSVAVAMLLTLCLPQQHQQRQQQQHRETFEGENSKSCLFFFFYIAEQLPQRSVYTKQLRQWQKSNNKTNMKLTRLKTDEDTVKKTC